MGTTSASATNQARWIAALRILMGIYFLYAGIPKLMGVLGISHEPFKLTNALDMMVKSAWPSWYHSFLTSFALPHAAVFGWLVALGEVAVGAGLVLGLFTRLSAGIGVFLNANYFFATFYGFARFPNLWYTVLHLLFIGTAAGRTWGLDALVVPRLPKWLRWLG